MVGALISEQERLDLIQQGDNIFLQVQEQLYDAKTPPASPDKFVSLFEKYTVYGSLDTVMDLYLNDDVKMVLDFSESREVLVLKHQTKERPRDRTSLRWSLFYPPSFLLAKAQDFCFLEIMKPFGTIDGRRGWAKCAHSITHKACPPREKVEGMEVNRAELCCSGLFFEETEQHGMLSATVYLNIKRDHATPLLPTRILKAQSKRTVELLNHYVKMSTMMLKSRELSLTTALQLQAERRCGTCANQLSIWKLKDKCVLCGSLMCDKCHDIVSRNFKVDGVMRGQVVCLCCAHRRGKKIVLEEESQDDMKTSASTSVFKIQTPSVLQTDVPPRSVSSLCSQEQSKWLANAPQQKRERAKTHHQRLIRLQSTPARTGEFQPQVTYYLPTDIAECQRRRRNTQGASCRDADSIIIRRLSRKTGNSKLSLRAKPTGHKKASLSDCDNRPRRYTTTSLVVQPIAMTDETRRASTRCHTFDGTTYYDHHSNNKVSPRPHSSRYSRENLCDISYVAGFK